MLVSCSFCSAAPQKACLKTISQTADGQVCLCIECGAFWKSSSTGWERLTSSERQKGRILSPKSTGTMALKLVKDFKNYQILFYWLDTKANKASPDMTTLRQAEEWIVDHYFSLYQGKERRQSTIDRRHLKKRQPNGQAVFFSKRKNGAQGRRITDHNIEVDIDLSAGKLNDLKHALRKAPTNADSSHNSDNTR